MGWFDSDSKTPTRPAPATMPGRSKETPRPSTRAEQTGSTIGRHVQVEGTIVSDENLTILGRVQGTIHARQRLTVAAGAELQATIHGRQVELAGKVTGDVEAVEAVLLRPSAELAGNIATPSLSIEEGAFFVGSVKMERARPEAEAPKAAKAARSGDGSGSAVAGKGTADRAGVAPADASAKGVTRQAPSPASEAASSPVSAPAETATARPAGGKKR